jgi:hypothetical protein
VRITTDTEEELNKVIEAHKKKKLPGRNGFLLRFREKPHIRIQFNPVEMPETEDFHFPFLPKGQQAPQLCRFPIIGQTAGHKFCVSVFSSSQDFNFSPFTWFMTSFDIPLLRAIEKKFTLIKNKKYLFLKKSLMPMIWI